MTIYQYLENLDMNYLSKATLFCLMTGRTESRNQMTIEQYVKTSQSTEVPRWFRTPENLLESLTLVNRMVKDETCPNNLKNRFYNQKKNLLRQLLKLGRVSDIYQQGDYLALTVDGEYKFHQPKEYFKGLDYDIAGDMDTVPRAVAIPFDRRKFDEFEAGYYIFMGQQALKMNGMDKEPKYYHTKKYKESLAITMANVNTV